MLYETSLIFRQSLKSTWRSPIWMIIMLFEPVCLLLLFAPLLDKLVGMPGFDNGTGSALAIFAPGLLVMLAIFGTAYSGFGVLYALRSGGVERLRVTGISPFALALGYALANVITLMLQAAIVMGLALLMGLRIHLAGTLIVLLLVAIMGVGISACSYAFALTIKEESILTSIISFLTIPLLLLSGVNLPLSFAPDWLQTVAKFNPFYHAVEGARSLVNGNFGASNIWIAFAAMSVFAALTLFWSAKSFSKATS